MDRALEVGNPPYTTLEKRVAIVRLVSDLAINKSANLPPALAEICNRTKARVDEVFAENALPRLDVLSGYNGLLSLLDAIPGCHLTPEEDRLYDELLIALEAIYEEKKRSERHFYGPNLKVDHIEGRPYDLGISFLEEFKRKQERLPERLLELGEYVGGVSTLTGILFIIADGMKGGLHPVYIPPVLLLSLLSLLARKMRIKLERKREDTAWEAQHNFLKRLAIESPADVAIEKWNQWAQRVSDFEPEEIVEAALLCGRVTLTRDRIQVLLQDPPQKVTESALLEEESSERPLESARRIAEGLVRNVASVTEVAELQRRGD